MYESEASCVYYCNPNREGLPHSRELFLTVHSVKDAARSAKEQAAAIAAVLNSDASLRYRITGSDRFIRTKLKTEA